MHKLNIRFILYSFEFYFNEDNNFFKKTGKNNDTK